MPDPTTLPARLRHLAEHDYAHDASAHAQAAGQTLQTAARELEGLTEHRRLGEELRERLTAQILKLESMGAVRAVAEPLERERDRLAEEVGELRVKCLRQEDELRELLEATAAERYADPVPAALQNSACAACGALPGQEHAAECEVYRANLRRDVEREQSLGGPGLRYLVGGWNTNADGPMPGGGSFVMAGRLGAWWRVHDAEVLAAGPVLWTLEPVDVHEVPLDAETCELPLPLQELDAAHAAEWPRAEAVQA